MTPLVAAVRSGDPWAFHAHADVFFVVAMVAIAYREALRRLGPRLAPAGEPVATRRQKLQFGGGLVLMFAVSYWPMHDLAEDYLFSVHMVQHTAYSLVVVPLLLLGMPGWLVSWLIRPVLPVMRRLVRPLPASLLFNGVIAISHAAVSVNYTASHELPHFAAHSLLVFVSAVMWLPVLHRRPELPQMSAPVKMVYLFAQSLLPNVPAAFLAFAESPLYQWYATAPRIFDGFSAVEDQQLGGAIMKLTGTMIIWGVIVTMFFRWYRDSERGGDATTEDELLRWEDVERELVRTPAPREP
jgi:putative membrane protein